MSSSLELQNIRKVLVANRGEIAVRCIRACRTVGVTSVSIYTKSDSVSLHATKADESVLLDRDGTAGYLDINNILRICKQTSIDAVIPGYGFLSENVQFAKAVTDAGMVFVGPSSDSITEMGLKHRAREAAMAANVPVVPGTDLLQSESDALTEAERLTYPVMLKATGGGGGMGLQICHVAKDVVAAFDTVRSRGEQLFKNSGVLLEKYYPRSRHIEVQVFGNGAETIHFGERECSIQRRHQKVIEECPSPFVEGHPGLRQRLTDCATRYASALNYKSAGTVEFLVDDDTGDFFFLEMNTRLQVEHGITEMCYGVDLVVLMLRQADMEMAGKGGIPTAELRSLVKSDPDGAAIEVRIYAENPYKNFAPSPGIFQEVRWPDDAGVRIDTWIQAGQEVSLHYDPLLAKGMVHATSRSEAILKMSSLCSRGIALKGPTTNLHFLNAIVTCDAFAKGRTLTSFLDTGFQYHPCGIDVVSAGSFSTIQDLPGRPAVGYGVPKSGPMDNISSRISNLLVGNHSGQEVIEITLSGPDLLFTSAAVVAVCGADVPITIDGTSKPTWSRLKIQAGQRLKIGEIKGSGCRAYIAVRGGFPSAPVILGSKSTTTSLKLGGCQGRQLRSGDFLQLDDESSKWTEETSEYKLPDPMIPSMDVSEICVLQGPHDSADIMTDSDRQMLYNTEWKVGHNSSRTGIRLVGPAPQWARTSGGEAGSHPSNYLDYGYPSPGGVNWGGDSSCIFSVDSPNLGGLICSSTVISGELWKLGQLRPGHNFRLTPVSLDNAVELISRIDAYMDSVAAAIRSRGEATVKRFPRLARKDVEADNAILKIVPASPDNYLRPKVTYRQGGDRFLLVEFGEQSPDVATIARIRLLVEELKSRVKTSLNITPHIGSVMIEYNPLEISQARLLAMVDEIESSLVVNLDVSIPCREFRLPLVMDHPDLLECTQRYMETVRSKAAYLPDNVEYLRKCNGLESRRDVFRSVLETDFVMVAVGFLCGTPVMFPLSPRRLEGQKYNPTRTNTPGGTLGIGGALLSGYSTEQPGGYMMVARTLEMWDLFGTKPGFNTDRPWLFEPLDVIKFYEVSIDEYDVLARAFAAGRYQWEMSPSTFNVRQAYELFRDVGKDPELIAFKENQRKGLEEQDTVESELYAEWHAEVGSLDMVENGDDVLGLDDGNTVAITSPMAANVWKVEVKPGDVLKTGQVVAILEAMKMEIKVTTPKSADGCRVHSVRKKPNNLAEEGNIIVVAKRII